MRSTLLFAAIFIVITASLCVFATLTGWVLDRRRDFAVMKALGASEPDNPWFLCRGSRHFRRSGRCLGFVIGTGIAAWISRGKF